MWSFLCRDRRCRRRTPSPPSNGSPRSERGGASRRGSVAAVGRTGCGPLAATEADEILAALVITVQPETLVPRSPTKAGRVLVGHGRRCPRLSALGMMRKHRVLGCRPSRVGAQTCSDTQDVATAGAISVTSGRRAAMTLKKARHFVASGPLPAHRPRSGWGTFTTRDPGAAARVRASQGMARPP